MTNKPMLSVERKVIEDILADAREPATDYMAARKVLRALLDKPAPEPVPVAWMRFDDDQKAIFTRSKRTKDSEALYVHPTAYRLPRAEQPAPVAHESECTSCDGSGEYTDAIGDWRGYCTCPAGVDAEGIKGLKP